MRSFAGALTAALVGATFGAQGGAWAADVTVAADGELTLVDDIILAGTDNFVAGADAGGTCHIHGAGHGIASATGWTGSFTLRNCQVDGLGRSDLSALELNAVGAAAIVIAGTTFSTSGAIDVGLADQASTTFRGNTIQDDSVVLAVVALADSTPAFHAQGNSTGAKLFQGNVIKKSRLMFQSTTGWLVGGEQAGDGNILVGTRAGIDLINANDMVIEGNFSHTTIPMLDWNQVKNITLGGGNIRVLHNVFWGFNWSTSIDATGEFAYNLIIDNIERGYGEIWNQAGAKVHHNLMVATRDNQDSPHGAYVIESHFIDGAAYSTEIYNNTFDGGGVCVPAIESAVLIKGGVLGSLRSNVFADLRVAGAAKALVRSDAEPDAGQAQFALLGYADYNLFYTPDSPVKAAYSVSVVGHDSGTAGAGQHDVSPTVTRRDDLDVPLFAQKIPRRFPFDEATIVAGTTTVCQVLAYYRQVYAPAAGSAMVGAGDPADGAGNFIGAIGPGGGAPGDLFGQAPFCDPSDVGHPDTSADIFTCKSVGLQASGTGGTKVVNPNHGFQCVCDAGGAPGDGGAPWGLLGAAGVAIAACKTRRRRI
jgi:hypothetical protein